MFAILVIRRVRCCASVCVHKGIREGVQTRVCNVCDAGDKQSAMLRMRLCSRMDSGKDAKSIMSSLQSWWQASCDPHMYLRVLHVAI